MGETMDLLRGAIDVHVHSAPDVIARKASDIAIVEQARAAGMRALLLKSHTFSTCERAYLLNFFYPDFKVFGGITLNDTIGGLNPKAVEAALKLGARCVWMPTKSAANHRRSLGHADGLTIADNGMVRAEVKTILRLIADADAVLATGHLAPEESRVLVEAALTAGVKRISVTHPEWGVTSVSIELQSELRRMGDGVYFERCLVSTQTDLREYVPFERIAEQIRAVGVESTIIATDFGMPQYPTPVEGMKLYIERLRGAGFTEREIKMMCQDNPAALLGLPSG
ncbi:MAG TPA: DUF6282 family protein [Pyrinomonadaceae bacterium]|nr:DUF6282 family protein [Pyrinomonadaceae bacterium]